MPRRNLLLNPGPVTLSARVRDAMANGDTCHREPEFAQLTQRVLEQLKTIYDDAAAYDSVLVAGSGTCAVEAMLATMAPEKSRTLVASNGVYGERIASMLEVHGKPMVHIVGDWLSPLGLDSLERRLRDDPSITHIATVHHETTTGRLNDLDSLGRICRELDRHVLLDAVSSFGAEEIRYEDWRIEALAATSNKCLHAPPGAAFVIARRELLSHPRTHPRSVYLDLRRYHAPQQESGYSPFTPAVNTVVALAEALDELAELGGWRARREIYRARSSHVADTLHELGISDLLEAGASSCVLRAYRLPQHMDFKTLHDRFADEHVVVYSGQGDLAKEIFRIACMGEITADDLEWLDSVLRRHVSTHDASA